MDDLRVDVLFDSRFHAAMPVRGLVVEDARKNPVFTQANHRASLTGYYSYWID